MKRATAKLPISGTGYRHPPWADDFRRYDGGRDSLIQGPTIEIRLPCSHDGRNARLRRQGGNLFTPGLRRYRKRIPCGTATHTDLIRWRDYPPAKASASSMYAEVSLMRRSVWSLQNPA